MRLWQVKKEKTKTIDKLVSHRMGPETCSVEADSAYILCISQTAFYMVPMHIIMKYNTI